MTHGKDDDGQHTKIDGQKVADLPGGVHLDTHEVKWVFAGILIGFTAIYSGNQEALYAFGAGALGMRAAPGPLKNYALQPWWAAGGMLTGSFLATVVMVIA